LATPNSVLSLSIGAVADQAVVSQPTVARFCRAIDCAGDVAVNG
jgi:RpiR family transcriptional regulator, carbohydrate utilization regulator